MVLFAKLEIAGSRSRRTRADGLATLRRRRGGRMVITAQESGATTTVTLRRRSVARAIGVREQGARAVMAVCRDPRMWRCSALVVRGREGERVVFRPLLARFGPRGIRRVETNSEGVAFVWVAAHG